MTLADAPLAELLDRLAARTPAPGGGTAAALVGATAAALTEMAAAFALTRSAEQDESLVALYERAAVLRAQLLQLADDDTRAYRPVLDAQAVEPKDERRAAALASALSTAAEVPLAIAVAAAEVAELAAATVLTPGNTALYGDASAALTLAEAAVDAAARLVELNLAAAPADPRLEQAAALARHATNLRGQQRSRQAS
jgi:methenyltetrahydrofolate cyclohydrolase